MLKKRTRKDFESSDNKTDDSEKEQIAVAQCLSILTDDYIDKNCICDFAYEPDCSDDFFDCQFSYSTNLKCCDLQAKYSKNYTNKKKPESAFKVSIMLIWNNNVNNGKNGNNSNNSNNNSNNNSSNDSKDDVECSAHGTCSCLPDFRWCKHIASLASKFKDEFESFSKKEITPKETIEEKEPSKKKHKKGKTEKTQKREKKEIAKKRKKYLYVVMYQKDFLESASDTRYPEYFDSNVLAIFEHLEDANKYARNYCENEFEKDLLDMTKEHDCYTKDGRFYCMNEPNDEVMFGYQEFVFIRVKQLF